jgi:hypothetical protein
MFGSSMAAHHLLFSYLSVWLIQGGYCAWIALRWMRSTRDSRGNLPASFDPRKQF